MDVTECLSKMSDSPPVFSSPSDHITLWCSDVVRPNYCLILRGEKKEDPGGENERNREDWVMDHL